MDVRAQILKEATRLFAAQGVGATSLQEVADAVGVRKPSLLYHFSSKEELHRSVLEELLSRWNEALPRLLKAVAREDRFDAVLGETVAFFAAEPDRARLLMREALDRPAAMRELLTRFAAPWLGVIAESIRKAQAKGLMRAEVDPEAYVLHAMQLIIASCATGTILQVLLPGPDGTAGAPTLPARLMHELHRMARSALLPDGAPLRVPAAGTKG